MANRKIPISILFLMFISLDIGLLLTTMDSVRAVRVIQQDGYAVGPIKFVRWWQVSGELERARQEESDPTLKIRSCKLRKGEVPEYVQRSTPEDKLHRRSRVEDPRICDTRV